MPPVLVDTDVAIDFLRGVDYAKPLLSELWKNDQVAISVLTIYELTAGMRENEKAATLNFVDACSVEPVTAEIAFKSGEIYRQYRTIGITLTSLDCLIASTALVKGFKVATRNTKHYPENGLLLEF